MKRTQKASLVLAVTALMSLMAWVQPQSAHAAKPILDSGLQIDTTKAYEGAQPLGDIFQNRAIYGKLEGGTPVDIYEFTSDRDATQTFSLMATSQQIGVAGKPTLIILDPTTATKDEQLPLPLPATGYHTGLIAQAENQTYFDVALMTKYTVVSQQAVELKKDTKYYFIVLDQAGTVHDYVIRTGTGRPWTFGDVVKNFGTWLRVKTDVYAGTSPFTFAPKALGLMLFFLGMMVFIGMWMVQQIFSLMANRSKPAAYLLVKLQQFGRITMWIGLWFWLLGSYIYFNRIGWTGIPFVMALIFVVIVILNLIETLVFSPRIAKLEVTKKEATIPLRMRKFLFSFFVANSVLLLGYLTLTGMLFTK